MNSFGGVFAKNVAVIGFGFYLEHKATDAPVTSGTVTIYYTLDGGTQATIAGTAVHEGNGQWSVNLTQAEMNGNIVALLVVHPDAKTQHITIRTETDITNIAAKLPSTSYLTGSANADGNIDSDINAQVADVINTDAQAELSAVPAANASLSAKINWLFLLARNKLESDGSTQTAYADDGTTSVSTSPVSDAAGTTTRGEWI